MGANDHGITGHDYRAAATHGHDMDLVYFKFNVDLDRWESFRLTRDGLEYFANADDGWQ